MKKNMNPDRLISLLIENLSEGKYVVVRVPKSEVTKAIDHYAKLNEEDGGAKPKWSVKYTSKSKWKQFTKLAGKKRIEQILPGGIPKFIGETKARTFNVKSKDKDGNTVYKTETVEVTSTTKIHGRNDAKIRFRRAKKNADSGTNRMDAKTSDRLADLNNASENFDKMRQSAAYTTEITHRDSDTVIKCIRIYKKPRTMLKKGEVLKLTKDGKKRLEEIRNE